MMSSDVESSPEMFRVYLMNDGFNMKEYVARVIMMVAGLPEEESESIMMQAGWAYSAVVGTWERPVAEHIYQGMKKAGLSAGIKPVEGFSDSEAGAIEMLD